MTRILLAIYLTSAATLTYEIGLTRLFSISQGYHFAFMVTSVALLGIGAGGAVVTVISGRRSAVGSQQPIPPSTDSPIQSFLSTLASLLSIAFVLSFAAANQIMFDPVKAVWNRLEFLKILAQYLILSIPFTVSGMILSAALRSMSDRVHRIYMSDMVGAGTGCILILSILSISGGEAAVIVAAALSLIASFLFCIPSRGKGKAVSAVAAVIFLFAVFGAVFGPKGILEVKMSPYRELASVLNFPGAKVVETIFSPSGRMEIVESPAVRAAPGISLTYKAPLPQQLGFTINGGGLSTVTSRKGDLSFLRHLPSSLAYRLRKGRDVFIIDPGGGMETLSALENGAKGVWGSETRGIVLSAMEGELSDFSGRLYGDIEIGHGYARSVLRESGRTFDIIQLPLTDTLGSSSSGIMGLQEQYNLTVEAFSEYIRYLKRDGFISASVYLLPPPRQELKLLSTIVEALEAGNLGDPGRPSLEKAKGKIIAIRSWGVLTILAKNGDITPSEIEAVKDFCREERFDLVWYPGMREDEANIYNLFQEPLYYRSFKTIIEGEREGFFRDYIFDVRPATDDRPFFGQTFKMTRMRETYESVGRKWGILIEGGYLLPWILIQSIFASILLIIAPLLIYPRPSGERVWVRGRSLLPITAYFSCIGIGYMFIEISLMQRMIPVLGEPVYAISAVLFTLLVSTGIGSYLSGHRRIVDRYPIHVILLIPALAVVYLILMRPVTDLIVAVPVVPRFLLTFLLFFPLGLIMGMPFPTGMSILGRRIPDLIPWAWCINGSFSVVSSVLAMMVALVWGFGTAHILAALCYMVAWLALLRLEAGRHQTQNLQSFATKTQRHKGNQ
jgi:hypothetical protein